MVLLFSLINIKQFYILYKPFLVYTVVVILVLSFNNVAGCNALRGVFNNPFGSQPGNVSIENIWCVRRYHKATTVALLITFT